MGYFSEVPPELTKNQALVMTALSDAKEPLTAYKILDLLRGKGFRAPLQVYRALNKLLEYGMVHRLESMNAFVACQHGNHEGKSIVAFTICEVCGEVTELSCKSVEQCLQKLTKVGGFKLNKSMVEIFGRCAICH